MGENEKWEGDEGEYDKISSSDQLHVHFLLK